MYFADEILAEGKRREEEEKKKALEEEMKKKMKENERKRKREDTEIKKLEGVKARAEKKAKREKVIEEKRQMKEINTCKAGCGRTCKTGPQWVGCESCPSFWVCSSCYATRAVKQQVRKHEKCCGK